MLAARKISEDYYYDEAEDYFDDYFEEAAAQTIPAKISVQQVVAVQPRSKSKVGLVIYSFFAVSILFALGALLILRYEKLTAANTQVNNLKYEIKNLTNEIEDQKIQIEFAMDITRAHEIASETLDMGYPAPQDIVKPDELEPVRPTKKDDE